MASYAIQFQKGLSLREFNVAYATEEQCREAICKARWGDGFVCPDARGGPPGTAASPGACSSARTAFINFLEEAFEHDAQKSPGGWKRAKVPAFRWVNTVLGNLLSDPPRDPCVLRLTGSRMGR